MIRRLLVLSLSISVLFAGRPAQALTFGDAALTVSVATVSGAILGASTLPFYEDSGKHTKNIFYGAAIGAVAGVFISAFAAVHESQEEDEEALLRRAPADHRFAFSRAIVPETSTSRLHNPSPGVLFWAPVTRLTF